MKQKNNNFFFIGLVLFLLMFIRILRKIKQIVKLSNVNLEESSIRIAAVGDSITAEHTPMAGYPRYLSHLLGPGYTIVNFGLSSHAVQKVSDFPYMQTSNFQKSLIYNPHIVLLMLGTNDSKNKNWENTKRFKEDYITLLKHYLSLGSVSRIILASPPAVFTKPPFFSQVNADNIIPIQQAVKEIAQEYNLEFIDMTQKTTDHPKWFIDGVHPTPEGAKQFAQIFYNQLNI